MGDIFRGMQEAKRERHQEWFAANMQVLAESGLSFEERNYGETLIFRAQPGPKCDFFPSTGRWRVAGDRRTYRGGKAFIAWYLKQTTV